jgi:hypothetical protein
MKLIRLTSNDRTGLFDNVFNEDIIIDEKSQIALHSFTAEIDTNEIIIDAQNNEIQYKLIDGDTSSSPAHIVSLSHGTYDSSNFGDLFADATVKMNAQISNITTELGLQWKVDTDVDKKVVFDIERGDAISPQLEEFASKVGKKNVVNTAQGIFNRQGGSAPNLDSFLWFKTPNCKGASVLRGRIQVQANSGFIVAYLATPPNANTNEILLNEILYGIQVDSSNTTGGFYKKIIRGNVSASLEVANVNDSVAIETFNGRIRGTIYRGTGSLNPLFTDLYDHTTNLFPVIIFTGATSRVDLIKFTADPFYDDLRNLLPPDANEINAPMPSVGKKQTTKFLQFSDIDLAKIFGFKLSKYTTGKVEGYKFVSENVFELSDYSDSFILELQNINLDSYDGLSKQRKNILHTIVQADVIKQRLVYNSPYPLFLNINNANKITQRRIKCRLLREDNSAIALTGFSQITLIIKSPNE